MFERVNFRVAFSAVSSLGPPPLNKVSSRPQIEKARIVLPILYCIFVASRYFSASKQIYTRFAQSAVQTER